MEDQINAYILNFLFNETIQPFYNRFWCYSAKCNPHLAANQSPDVSHQGQAFVA